MQVSNVPFNIATGEIGNISMKPDTNAMNAQFMQAYQSAWPDAAAAEGLSDEEAQVKTWMSIGGQLGFFPTDDSMWKQLPEYEKVKEASFWRTVNATMMDQNWVDAVKSQAGGDLSREDLRDNAVYKVSQTAYNGWLPDGMREALQKRAENSPLTPATQERAYAMGFGKGSEVSPQEAAIAHQAANREEIVQSAAKTGAQTGARIGTEFAMEPLRPIPGKTKAQYGLGPGINTWKDLESFGGRLPTAKDREDYQDLIALQQMIDQMEKNLSLIWNSGPDVLSRLKHGASLQWEKAQGTEVGRAIQNYEKIRPLAARRVGAAVERGGRFTDQDQKQFSKSFPELGMMPDSAQVAQSAVENLRELMTGKMKIFRNVLLEPPTSGETTKRKPGETPEEFLKRTGGM